MLNPLIAFGPVEIGIALVIVVLLFGAKKIPELARSSGQAIGEFKRGRNEAETDIRDELDEEMATETAN